ncbi:MAG: DUF2961 domain-containing protein [Verrucomicrobiales bacterium]|jgi:hypothetical protein|nr:DUF2961 domain-containing protein [Verrucomicrobiales bacterium]
MKKIAQWLVLAGGLAWATESWSATTYTYPDLVRQLTDLERLATLPADGESGALASSYDRASKYDEATGKYVAWGANGDGGGVIRREGEEAVFAELEGPGVIWRIWSATVGEGHVKIYLDGATTPAVDLPFKAYFDRSTAPFTREQLIYKTKANGYNNYTPISFQKSCKIVADPQWGNYYHFNYTKFPPGTVVPTFKLPLSAADEAALDRADKIFAAVGADPADERAGAKTETKTLTVPAGGSALVADLAGSGAITALKVKIDNLPADPEEQLTLLAQLTVSAAWDGAAKPAVWSPLGDFFGSSAGATPFRTLPAGVGEDGQFYSYWYLPFATGAKLAVGNDSPLPVTLAWEVTTAPLTADAAARLGRFHAKWHRDAFLPDAPERREIDWTLLVTKGRGRLVGVQLHVWNPLGGWWGEGDEKFWVDGEKFPSTIGTGSEDYFGYAWSSGGTFIQALHSQPVNEHNNGHVSVNRWHIADNIPFQKSFEGALEKYFTNERGTLFAAVAYWYLSADGDDPYPPLPVTERTGWWVRPDTGRAPGVIEGEELRVLNGKVAGPHYGQEMFRWGKEHWSNWRQLIWQSAAAGQRLELSFKAPAAGKFKLLAKFTKCHDYGIFQLDVDGKPAGPLVDLYRPGVTSEEVTDLGVVELTAGDHVLGVICTGKNEQAKQMFFGLDYIKLEPAQ